MSSVEVGIFKQVCQQTGIYWKAHFLTSYGWVSWEKMIVTVLGKQKCYRKKRGGKKKSDGVVIFLQDKIITL